MTSFSLRPSLSTPARAGIADRLRPHLPMLRLGAALLASGTGLAVLFLACGALLLEAASPAITTVVDALDLTL
ncbi:hypothetical protein [Leifsonia sp. NPDC080035]|uniref:Uncharacterized protein n=1 Tax=Leifsonia sp. NPDC080035 TaxID=3143936 RepID=A0AAU7G8Q0_9MICO